jgi:hypothetical protein
LLFEARKSPQGSAKTNRCQCGGPVKDIGLKDFFYSARLGWAGGWRLAYVYYWQGY